MLVAPMHCIYTGKSGQREPLETLFVGACSRNIYSKRHAQFAVVAIYDNAALARRSPHSHWLQWWV